MTPPTTWNHRETLAWRALRRARAHAVRWSEPRLRRLLERLTRRTVIVTEYRALPRARWGWEQPPHPELDARLATGRDAYVSLLDGFERHLPALKAIPRVASDSRSPAWDNDFFAGLDAVALYCLLAERAPARYVEIGSGNSTRFARRAIEDLGLSTRVISIDPFPRAEIDELCDEVHRVGLQDAPVELFEQLEPGDVVVLDGSHLAYMGSDVTVAFTEVLPRLPEGVLVGIDDVFLPWDYPPTWEARWYTEQYLLAMMLLSPDPSWRVVLPGWWVAHDPALAPCVERFSDPAGTFALVFWMERVTTE